MKIIIIGGVAGGMSAATRLRRLDEEAEIIVIEKGPYVSFANCGLPYYVSGEIDQRSDLLVQTPASLKARFNLDVRPESEAVAIDSEGQTVEIKTGETSYWETYDKLILSPGARPVVPPISGLAEAANTFTLRNVPDLDKIMTQLETLQPKTATVIGAGFIGLEMAENLKTAGLEVTVVEKAPHVLPPLDQEMAAFVEKELQEKGVTVLTNVGATAFRREGQEIELDNGDVIASDITILSVGVVPETGLATQAGVTLGHRGGIEVNDQYQTSVPNIYAVGDAIVVKQQITGGDALISLASPANRQGRQVADVIAGLPRKNKGSIGTAIVRVFNMTAATTGLTERQAKEAGLAVAVVHSKGKDHAGYYPGSTGVILKLIFNPETGVIYGAQGVGEKGIDKRIDVLATAIKAGLTVPDLPELEFTYAPPFGVAKDPVNMIGYMALNVMEGQTEMVQWHELADELADGAVLLDVRSDEEMAGGKIAQGEHIPLPQLRQRITELDKSQRYIVSCESGLRSYIAERQLKQQGFDVRNLDGAFSLYATVLPQKIIR